MDNSTAPTEKLNVVVTIGPARRREVVAARAPNHLQGLLGSTHGVSPPCSEALEAQLNVGVAASGSVWRALTTVRSVGLRALIGLFLSWAKSQISSRYLDLGNCSPNEIFLIRKISLGRILNILLRIRRFATAVSTAFYL